MKKKTAKQVFISFLCCLICVTMIAFSSPTLIFATSVQETEESSEGDDSEKEEEKSDKNDE